MTCTRLAWTARWTSASSRCRRIAGSSRSCRSVTTSWSWRPRPAIEPPGAPRCPLAALDGQPFVGFDRDIPTRRLVDHLLRRHGVRVTYVMELDNVETIKRSVEAGLGLSLLPAPTLAAEIRARTLVARPPAEGPFYRPIAVIHRRRRELSTAARAFLELITTELGSAAAKSKG